MALSGEDRAAQAALRARQGDGARYDAEEAPAEDLLLARRATAFFARKLNELEDPALLHPLDYPLGWTRAHVLAKVGYDARRLAIALEPLCPAASYLPPETMMDDLPSLDLAATLPARALRHLFQHSAIHLDVCWRDLPGKAWESQLAVGRTEAIPVRNIPRLRAILLWREVLALDCGASQRDAPEEIRNALATEGEAR